MEPKEVDRITQLLQRMKQERAQTRPPPHQPEEDEDDQVMPSRYVKEDFSSDDLGEVSEDSQEEEEVIQPPIRAPRTNSLRAFERPAVRSESSDSEEEEVEDPRTKLAKRMEELRARRQMLGPPARVQAEVQRPLQSEKTREVEEEQKESLEADLSDQSDQEEVDFRPATAQPKRPSTSRIPTTPSFIHPPSSKPKRTDPVSLYQQRQREWQNSKFLKANKENAREGRKLKLAAYSLRPSFQVVHERPPVPKQGYVAPHEKRRDDLRLQTRARMAAPVAFKRPQTAKS